MAKQVMDIKNSHGISQGESDENQRNWTEKQWKNKIQMSGRNYDYSRRNLNFEVAGGKVQKIDTSKSIDQKMREMCAARGMRWPNDPNPRLKPGADTSKVKKRNVAACFIFEGSRQRMHEIAFGGYGVVDLRRGADNSHVRRCPEIERWALDTYNWVGRKFGFENIAGFYCHLDETNPHIHCDVLPVAIVKGKERVSYNKVFGAPSKVGNQQKWRAFHDSYYEEVGSKWGLDRGDDIQITGAKHKTYEQYQEELRKDIKKGEKKVKSLATMVHNLEVRQSELEIEISYLEDETGNNEKLLLQKKKQLEIVLSQLSEKRASLDNAEQQLLEKKQEIEGKNEEVKRLSSHIDELHEDLKELEGQQRTLNTKVKGLTTMVNNLTNQLEELKNDKNTTEEELTAVKEKLQDKQEKLDVANQQLKETQLSVEALSEELAQLEEKRVTLTEGATNLIGAQLSSWGDSISRKFLGKDDAIREETRKETVNEIMQNMTQVSGSWVAKDNKTYVPTPKEYAEKYKYYKNQVSHKEHEVKSLTEEVHKLTTENQTLQSKVKNASSDAKKAVEEAYSVGYTSGKEEVQTKMNRVQGVLFGMWPTAKSAVNAIVTKSYDSSQRWLGPDQAEAIFNSLKNCFPEEREDAARDLIELSKNHMERGYESWFEQTAEEVLNIAENFSELAVLFAVPVQGAAVSTGGGGGGNNDLPKKRDDDWWEKLRGILRPSRPSVGFRRRH